MVGFRFENAHVLGLALPFHRHFDEVNLRFYVGREVDGEWRRGVVFIKEIVPRRLIAWIARTFYGENFVALPMRSERQLPAAKRPTGAVQYEWFHGQRWQRLAARIAGPPQPPRPGSLDEFITEHYWAYSAPSHGVTREYRVEHQPWAVWRASDACCDCDVAGLYGASFLPYLSAAPASACVAVGSEVLVRKRRLLEERVGSHSVCDSSVG
jgi:uncharacterized protein YqjF (DUF2071 family)